MFIFLCFSPIDSIDRTHLFICFFFCRCFIHFDHPFIHLFSFFLFCLFIASLAPLHFIYFRRLTYIIHISSVAEALSYDDRVDPAPLTGTQTLDSTPQKRAIEALQTLLRKLPNRQTTQDNYINDIDDVDIHGHENDLKSPPKPYDIPNDPVRIPAFKPIHKTPAITTTYTVQLGPIETVTKHTIGGGGDVSMAATPNHSKFTIVQNPHPNYTIQTSVQHSKRPPGNSPNRNHKNNGPRSETAVNQPPLNLYHTMTLRNGHEQHHRHHHPPHHPQQSQPSTLLHVPGEKQPYNAHNIDIQKSIEYRIQ